MVRLISGEHLKEIVILSSFFFFLNSLYCAAWHATEGSGWQKSFKHLFLVWYWAAHWKQLMQPTCSKSADPPHLRHDLNDYMRPRREKEGVKCSTRGVEKKIMKLPKTLSMPSSARARNCSYVMNKFGGCLSQSMGTKSSTQNLQGTFCCTTGWWKQKSTSRERKLGWSFFTLMTCSHDEYRKEPPTAVANRQEENHIKLLNPGQRWLTEPAHWWLDNKNVYRSHHSEAGRQIKSCHQ